MNGEQIFAWETGEAGQAGQGAHGEPDLGESGLYLPIPQEHSRGWEELADWIADAPGLDTDVDGRADMAIGSLGATLVVASDVDGDAVVDALAFITASGERASIRRIDDSTWELCLPREPAPEAESRTESIM